MQSKSLRYIIGCCVVLILVFGAFSGGIIAGWFLPIHKQSVMVSNVQTIPQPNPTETGEGNSQSQPSFAQAPSAELDQIFAPFWEAWQIVHDQFIDQPVDDLALMRGAIRGMMEALGDKHSSYMDPDQYKQANITIQGEYEGIGAWVDTTGDYLTIVSPMPDSPAEKAGLKPGDQVIAVDGEDMTGIDGQIAIQHVMGPAGSVVKLTIVREGETSPRDVEVTRAKITVASVAGKMLDQNIAYVQLNTFGDTTTEELKSTLKELLDQKPTGLILDLRNNGGGYLDTAIEVASQFIGDGVVMYEQTRDGKMQEFRALSGGLATDIPLVVLVNEGTASASEIVSGAIQDRGRGKLVGMTTYGKGSVQNWIELSNGEGAVRVTIARWLTPNQRQIHEKGLTPDYEIPLTEEDYNANRDPQLDKAVEILTQH